MSFRPDTLWPRREAACLVVVDVQENLARAMPADTFPRVTRNLVLLATAARTLGLPVLLTEQYPKGLGRTIGPVAEALAGGGTPPTPIEKVDFACTAVPAFREALQASGRRTVILAGVEAHVCVLQTALGLLEAGYAVQVPADAVASRTAANRQIGVDLMGRAGAVVTSTETVVFQLLGRAGTPEFKALAPLVKEP
ncbi:MAG TPA: isochorismatase family protein [Thermodesulfobacteriota bacterium]